MAEFLKGCVVLLHDEVEEVGGAGGEEAVSRLGVVDVLPDVDGRHSLLLCTICTIHIRILAES